MEKTLVYEIQVEGHLTDRWSAWFEGLAVQHDVENQTTLVGPVHDQAELFGILGKIHALNLTLISVRRVRVNDQ